jgi:hypothetical protein
MTSKHHLYNKVQYINIFKIGLQKKQQHGGGPEKDTVRSSWRNSMRHVLESWISMTSRHGPDKHSVITTTKSNKSYRRAAKNGVRDVHQVQKERIRRRRRTVMKWVYSPTGTPSSVAT